MADTWSLSSPDSDDDSAAVEDIISQAMDLSTLQQIAALNSSLASDSLLPTDLEARFRKLKSFPPASASASAAHIPNNQSKVSKPKIPHQTPAAEEEETQSFSDDLLKPDYLVMSASSPSSPYREIESSVPHKSKSKRSTKNLDDPKSRRRSGSFSSPSISSNSSSKGAASHSPPKQTCCFWCSPKKMVSSREKSKDGEMGSDLSSISLKDHQRKMEKILKEQEEMISREAEKVLKWAKQATAK